MNYKERYQAWLEDDFFDEATRRELLDIQGDEREMEDRFYTSLAFGTAGLRGKLGAGLNRMNPYTVGAACEGLARFIEKQGEEAKKRGVSIAYDVRHGSLEFAEESAEILAAHGIHAYLHKDICPTPVLSYTVRETGSFAGIMVTASHNPKEYNGYKVYNGFGSQILDQWAVAIEKEIAGLGHYREIQRMPLQEALEKGLVDYVQEDLWESYYSDVLSLTIHDQSIDKGVKLVYTPLNGCGNHPVRHILQARGFEKVYVVEEQADPDPDFTTVGYPNPEDPKVFAYAEKLGREKEADLLFATDPDSDRCAMEVRNEQGDYVFFNGNKIGALLGHYVLSQRKDKGTLPSNAAVIKSIVTGDLLFSIARDYGVHCMEVLTGFKNIAEPVNEWDQTHEYEYVFGFEESIGYNPSQFIRDKDAVSSAMLILEMAAYYKAQGKTLLEVLEEIYQQYGYHNDRLISTVLEGVDGIERMGRIMEEFRQNPLEEIGGMKLVETIDYAHDDTGLSPSNVLRYFYDDGSWYAIRPSGTEPKIKVYLYTVGQSLQESEEKLQAFAQATADVFQLVR